MTITHDALDLTVQGPPPPVLGLSLLYTGSRAPPPQLVAYVDRDWIPVQACSLGDLAIQSALPFRTGADMWWLAMYSGRAGGTHPTGMLSCYDKYFIPYPCSQIRGQRRHGRTGLILYRNLFYYTHHKLFRKFQYRYQARFYKGLK